MTKLRTCLSIAVLLVLGCQTVQHENQVNQKVDQNASAFTQVKQVNFRDAPLLNTPNVPVWEKDMGGGGKIVVERAYLYPRENLDLPKTDGQFQYAFILLRDGEKPQRVVKWVRRISDSPSFASGLYPDPQLRILDVQRVDNDLLVLFNQHHYCFCYRVTKNDVQNGRFMTIPDSDPLSTISVPDPGCVGEVMREGKIKVVDDKVMIICRNDQGEQVFELIRTPEGQFRWKRRVGA